MLFFMCEKNCRWITKSFGIILCVVLMQYSKMEDNWSTIQPFQAHTFLWHNVSRLFLCHLIISFISMIVYSSSPKVHFASIFYTSYTHFRTSIEMFRSTFILWKELSIDEHVVSYIVVLSIVYCENPNW